MARAYVIATLLMRESTKQTEDAKQARTKQQGRDGLGHHGTEIQTGLPGTRLP